ncbi:MAG: hypothetical protein AAF368_20115, partial [Planctomycetota bacterium]
FGAILRARFGDLGALPDLGADQRAALVIVFVEVRSLRWALFLRYLPCGAVAWTLRPVTGIVLSYLYFPLLFACCAVAALFVFGLGLLDCLVVGWSHAIASQANFRFVLSQPFVRDAAIPCLDSFFGSLSVVIRLLNGIDDVDLGMLYTVHVGIHGLRGAILHKAWPEEPRPGWEMRGMIIEETLENLSDILVAVSNPKGFFSLVSIGLSIVDALAEIGIQTGTAERRARTSASQGASTSSQGASTSSQRASTSSQRSARGA